MFKIISALALVAALSSTSVLAESRFNHSCDAFAREKLEHMFETRIFDLTSSEITGYHESLPPMLNMDIRIEFKGVVDGYMIVNVNDDMQGHFNNCWISKIEAYL